MWPKMERCGTRHVFGSEFDLDSPTFMIWDPLVRFDFKSRPTTAEGENCLPPRVCKRSLWLTVSKASRSRRLGIWLQCGREQSDPVLFSILEAQKAAFIQK